MIDVDACWRRVAGCLLAAGLVLGAAGQGAEAQSRPSDPHRPRAAEPSSRQQAPPRGGRSVRSPRRRPQPDLSNWARPDRDRGATWSGGGETALSNPSGPPDNPDRTPIGGMGWLVAAGAGYGVYRLRRDE